VTATLRSSAVAAACALTLALPSGASGAITVGSHLQRAPDFGECFVFANVPHSCGYALRGLAPAHTAPGGAVVPSDGVLVRWRLRAASAVGFNARLRAIRANTAVGGSAAVSVPAPEGVYEFQVRMPVKAGDLIGLDTLDVPGGQTVGIFHNSGSSATDLVSSWVPPLADGETRAPTSPTVSHLELLVNADLEPDADADGYGDQTQDACPSQAEAHGPCVPTTTITKAPKRTLKKPKTLVSFAADQPGATFECKLDNEQYAPCISPKKLKHLDRGRHKFTVFAVSQGVADPVPAKALFKVKRGSAHR
jgi:hypothetical protein